MIQCAPQRRGYPPDGCIKAQIDTSVPQIGSAGAVGRAGPAAAPAALAGEPGLSRRHRWIKAAGDATEGWDVADDLAEGPYHQGEGTW